MSLMATGRSKPPSGQYTARTTRPMPPEAMSSSRRYLPKSSWLRTSALAA